MANVKELKEAIVAINEISILLCQRLKDGVGVDDVAAIVGKLVADVQFRAAIEAGFAGVGAIPAEVSDLSLEEGLELAMLQIGYVGKIIAALTGK